MRQGGVKTHGALANSPQLPATQCAEHLKWCKFPTALDISIPSAESELIPAGGGRAGSFFVGILVIACWWFA
jgi:hypothetical protein